jgi:hypothetical protein
MEFLNLGRPQSLPLSQRAEQRISLKSIKIYAYITYLIYYKSITYQIPCCITQHFLDELG